MTGPASDPNIISKYFSEYIRRGFNNIFAEQRRIAATRIYSTEAYRTDGTRRSRSGQLQKALENPVLILNGSGSSLSASVNYPTYLRFLDMKRLGNYRIYNRPIWGILYKETLQDIRYEFHDWLKKYMHDALTESFQH